MVKKYVKKKKTIKPYSYRRNGKKINVSRHKRRYKMKNPKLKSKNISLKEAKKAHKKRSEQAQTIDERQTAKETFKAGQFGSYLWKISPDRYDIEGIDTYKPEPAEYDEITKEDLEPISQYAVKVNKNIPNGEIPHVQTKHEYTTNVDNATIKTINDGVMIDDFIIQEDDWKEIKKGLNKNSKINIRSSYDVGETHNYNKLILLKESGKDIDPKEMEKQLLKDYILIFEGKDSKYISTAVKNKGKNDLQQKKDNYQESDVTEKERELWGKWAEDVKKDKQARSERIKREEREREKQMEDIRSRRPKYKGTSGKRGYGHTQKGMSWEKPKKEK